MSAEEAKNFFFFFGGTLFLRKLQRRGKELPLQIWTEEASINF